METSHRAWSPLLLLQNYHLILMIVFMVPRSEQTKTPAIPIPIPYTKTRFRTDIIQTIIPPLGDQTSAQVNRESTNKGDLNTKEKKTTISSLPASIFANHTLQETNTEIDILSCPGRYAHSHQPLLPRLGEYGRAVKGS